MILPSTFNANDIEQSEVIKATQHWLEHMVIGLNLCPFAKAVHIKNKIAYQMTTALTTEQLYDELDALLTYMSQTSADQVDTALLIHPQVLNDFFEYTLFLKQTDALLKRKKLRGVFQIASFHPDYEFEGEPVDSVSHYTNRSPYPMLHILREDSIDRAVQAFPDPTQIVDKNIQTLQSLGIRKIKALLSSS